MNKFLITGLVILGAITGSALAYVAGSGQMRAVRSDFAMQIENLSQQIVRNQEQYSKEIAALKSAPPATSGTQQSDTSYSKATSDLAGAQVYPKQRGEMLKLNAPKGGEVICLNRETEIQWEGSPKIQIVNLYLIDPKDGEKYIAIDSVPFNHGGVEGGTTGSYIWTVGRFPRDPYVLNQPFVNPGDAYRIHITATYPMTSYEGLLVYDSNDKPISIANCQ